VWRAGDAAKTRIEASDTRRQGMRVRTRRRTTSAVAEDARAAFEQFVSPLDYPMFVVTAGTRRRHEGCLVGFATQTSIDPPRLLVCLSRRNVTTRVAHRARFLVLHQLSELNRDLARLFGEESGEWTDKFSRCRWRPGPHGVRVLSDCSAWVVGRIMRRIDLGDHVGFLLAPTAAARIDVAAPLTLQQVDTLSPGHPA
jgi:flavin reductase (DIM6/NTAB) family NADH-FMN oxidoreductase RutF